MKDLLPTLEMLLRQNNAAVVRGGGHLQDPADRGGARLGVAAARRLAAAHSRRASRCSWCRCKYVGAREMPKLLEPFAADNTVRIDEIRNLVIMAGNQRELRHLLDTVELFDVDWLSGYSVGIFPIKSADVKTLVARPRHGLRRRRRRAPWRASCA